MLAWTAVVATGLWLRYQDEQRQAAVAAVRQEVRLDLARELHDVVAHHITGLVVQTQAARLTAAQRPETVSPSLAGIRPRAPPRWPRCAGWSGCSGTAKKAAASGRARRNWPSWPPGSPGTARRSTSGCPPGRRTRTGHPS